MDRLKCLFDHRPSAFLSIIASTMPTVTVVLKWASYGYMLKIQGLHAAGPIIAAFLDCKNGAQWYEDASAGCRTVL